MIVVFQLSKTDSVAVLFVECFWMLVINILSSTDLIRFEEGALRSISADN